MPRSDLNAVLERPYADTAEGTLRFFVALIDALRPHDPFDAAAATSFTLLRDIAV